MRRAVTPIQAAQLVRAHAPAAGAGGMNAPQPQPQQDAETLGDVLVRIMLDLALRQPDPADRAAMLDILRKDGWLK